jgi:hypothetical protein
MTVIGCNDIKWKRGVLPGPYAVKFRLALCQSRLPSIFYVKQISPVLSFEKHISKMKHFSFVQLKNYVILALTDKWGENRINFV